MASETSTNKTEISIERVKDCLSGKSEDLIKRLLDNSNSTALRAMIGPWLPLWSNGEPYRVMRLLSWCKTTSHERSKE